MTIDPSSTASARFFGIAEALCRAVGRAIGLGFVQAAMAMLVVRRIYRVRLALLGLEARFLAGRTLRRVRSVAEPDVPPGPVVEILPQRARAVGVRLPRRMGWLFGFVPGEAACFAGQLRGVLAEPAMQALLVACPQAVRVLGPLCRMLGIERAAYVPAGADDGAVRVRRSVRVVVSRRRERDRLTIDPAAEDAHYAFTGVPRRFRLRVG